MIEAWQGVVVVVDVETLPLGAARGMTKGTAPGWEPPPFVAPERRTCPGTYKKPESIVEWEKGEDERHAADVEASRATWGAAGREKAWLDWSKGGLNPMGGRIWLAAVTVLDQSGTVVRPARVFRASSEADEGPMLTELSSYLQDIGKYSILVAHNAPFETAFLTVRGLRNKVSSLVRRVANDTGKPWDGKINDTMKLWPCGGRTGVNGSAKLDDIIDFLGLTSDLPPNPITGSGILDAYIDGRDDDAIEHVTFDVAALAALYRTLVENGMFKPSY